MKPRAIAWIAAGVIAAHALLFYFISGWNPLPKVPHTPPPDFSLGWAKFTDPATHDKMVYQEFTLSTSLAKPAAAGGGEPVEPAHP